MVALIASSVAQGHSLRCPLPCLQSGQKSRASICKDWAVTFATAGGVMRIGVFRNPCYRDGVDFCSVHGVLCMVDGAGRSRNAFGFFPLGRLPV